MYREHAGSDRGVGSNMKQKCFSSCWKLELKYSADGLQASTHQKQRAADVVSQVTDVEALLTQA